MTDKELFTMALDVIATPHPGIRTNFSDAMIYREKVKTAIEALRARLAQPDGVVLKSMRHPEILAVDENADVNPDSLETIEIDLPEPEDVEREWVGLTKEEIIRLRNLYDPTAHWSLDMFARVIEAKLKEKNT